MKKFEMFWAVFVIVVIVIIIKLVLSTGEEMTSPNYKPQPVLSAVKNSVEEGIVVPTEDGVIQEKGATFTFAESASNLPPLMTEDEFKKKRQK